MIWARRPTILNYGIYFLSINEEGLELYFSFTISSALETIIRFKEIRWLKLFLFHKFV